MLTEKRADPVAFKGVMVSSTFTDLAHHRNALVKAIDAYDLKAVVMENDSAKPEGDVLDSSLEMVRKAAAYVGVISHKYGQVPDDADRNPEGLSLTELEFNEAVRLARPVLLFIMGPDHPVKAADVEIDPEKKKKLDAFRERAKRLIPTSSVQRVYKVFNDLQDFGVAAMQSIGYLRDHLEDLEVSGDDVPVAAAGSERDRIPTPPALYAEPPYIGSHQFVGREAQLQTLSDWASAADPHPVLLFEAIGGAGKSMLTWEWMTRHASKTRDDWAGRFWYSFYEKGAVMADFCQRALAYMTRRPFRNFRKKKTAELRELLLRELQARPWLLVLDGLERVLVAYHRIDAAELADEEAGTTDKIARRDPCAAIRPEDDELLRALASAAPSKLLLTSRLIPRVLLNPASQPIPGVLQERLPGLRPPDAEALLRSCGITGDSEQIQNYLKTHCDCHPLVTGVLAGLINDYLPDRGNFDAWAAARDGGAALNLADLDLVQKRNHILHTALAALPEKSRQFLSILALLSEATDYATLIALNPYAPPPPEEVKEPIDPEKGRRWRSLSDEEKIEAREQYQEAVRRRSEYEQAVEVWRHSLALLEAPQHLSRTVRDLERRGFLQYDSHTRRYDLHPVVRGIAAGGLQREEVDRYGQRVVDLFSQVAHSPYEEAETLEDVRDGLRIVRTLLRMGRYQEAYQTLRDDLATALLFNLEAHPTILALLRPLFPNAWDLPECVDEDSTPYLANLAAISLRYTGALDDSFRAYDAALRANLKLEHWAGARTNLGNISYFLLQGQNRPSAAERCALFSLELATVIENQEELISARLRYVAQLARRGRRQEADEVWNLLEPTRRDWKPASHWAGLVETTFAECLFLQGEMRDEHLRQAENLAREGRNRSSLRGLHSLRGEWQLAEGHWQLAADSLHEAVRMAREVAQTDPAAEAQLALASVHLGRLHEARQEAERLASASNPSHVDIAALWLAIGDPEQAMKHALAAYKRAWADGEPFVFRYGLNKARALLEQLGAEIPDLPPYDPTKDPKFSWEDEVTAVIEKLRREKAAGEESADA
jgi:hypothetical protein